MDKRRENNLMDVLIFILYYFTIISVTFFILIRKKSEATYNWIKYYLSSSKIEYTLNNCVIVISLKLREEYLADVLVIIKNYLQLGAQHVIIYDPSTSINSESFSDIFLPLDNKLRVFLSQRCTLVQRSGLSDFAKALGESYLSKLVDDKLKNLDKIRSLDRGIFKCSLNSDILPELYKRKFSSLTGNISITDC
ncbi:hypothetical protein HZS_2791 [Henneguya salminicola]|nr:hypothetical protein HZS_2791 [Henneguya salminicola]